jgi:hypothetical protein
MDCLRCKCCPSHHTIHLPQIWECAKWDSHDKDEYSSVSINVMMKNRCKRLLVDAFNEIRATAPKLHVDLELKVRVYPESGEDPDLLDLSSLCSKEKDHWVKRITLTKCGYAKARCLIQP